MILVINNLYFDLEQIRATQDVPLVKLTFSRRKNNFADIQPTKNLYKYDLVAQYKNLIGYKYK